MLYFSRNDAQDEGFAGRDQKSKAKFIQKWQKTLDFLIALL